MRWLVMPIDQELSAILSFDTEEIMHAYIFM